MKDGDKFRKIVLHFGGDKTGSTSIQAVLDQARERMRNNGIAYPPGKAHARFGSFFCDFPERYVFNVHERMFDREYLKQIDRAYFDELSAWLEGVPPGSVVVFSYEGFAELDEQALCRMKVYCESIANEVSVVYYVRSPLSYAVSAMSQRVKQGRLAWPAGCPPLSPHRDLIRKVVDVFGKTRLCVRVFSADRLKNGDVVDDFCEVLGAAPTGVGDAAGAARRTNESLSFPAFVAGEALIREMTERGMFLGEAEFHEQYGRRLARIPGARIRLSPAQADELLAASKAHTEYLAAEFGITFSEDVRHAVCDGLQDVSGTDATWREVGKVIADLAGQGRRRRADHASAAISLLRAEIGTDSPVQRGDLLCFNLEFSVAEAVARMQIGIQICDEVGRLAFGINTAMLGLSLGQLEPGSHRARYSLVADLPQGRYTAGFAFAEVSRDVRRELGWYDQLLAFEVTVPRPNPCIGYAWLPVQFALQPVGEAIGCLIEDGRGRIECPAVPAQAVVGEELMLPVRLHNASSQIWCGTLRAPLFLSYHWLGQDGAMILFDGERSPLSAGAIAPGQIVESQLRCIAPSTPGSYRLLLIPVQEGHRWFDELGFTPAELAFTIVGAA